MQQDEQIQDAENIRKYIEQLREEAKGAKSCFTQYSFQALAFTSAAIALVMTTIDRNPLVSIAVLPLAILIDGVMWIGIYKYTAANRAYRYQMYLEKAATLYENYNNIQAIGSELKKSSIFHENSEALKLILNKNHWEQTFRVFRIIEPTIFNKIYVSPTFDHNILKSKAEKEAFYITIAFFSLIIGSIFFLLAYCRFSLEWAILSGFISFTSSYLLLIYRTWYKAIKRFDYNNYSLSCYSQFHLAIYSGKKI